MSDDLARLESALRETSPKSPGERRERALSAAMASFDRQYQGTDKAARHKGQIPHTLLSRTRRFAMLLPRPSLEFAGGAAAAVLAAFVAFQVLVTPLPPLPESAGVLDPGGLEYDFYTLVEPSRRAETMPSERESTAPGTRDRVKAELKSAALRAPEAESVTVTAMARAAQPDEVVALMEKGISAKAPSERPPGHYGEHGRDSFESFDSNPVKVVAEAPVSTFSIDVDTASYAFVRASLNRGSLPNRDAVRIEEMVNYFPYAYAPPAGPETPFATHVSLMPAPWNDATRLLHIGIKGYVPERHAAPPANLVFLIDTSGSMDEPNKLPLLVESFKLLTGALAPEDRIAIVAYAGSAGVVLEPTRIAERNRILASLDRLAAGGVDRRRAKGSAKPIASPGSTSSRTGSTG